MTELPTHPFGRVDADGTVYVREGEVERQVGQYPDGTPQEALEYFVRKFDDLAASATLLEQRSRAGANPHDIARSVKSLREQVEGANAVGDFASLRGRLDALEATVAELDAQQQEQHKQEQAEAYAYREQIVVQAEQLAAQNPESIQWRQTSTKLDELFAAWQEHQKSGPRLGKAEANALWKRFRVARSTLDAHRRKFYQQLDSQHREARDAKQKIIDRAVALAPKGADGVAEYRELLDQWKRIGRAGRKYDDALWAEFKAAGDVLYQAKAEVDARDEAEYQQNLQLKLEILKDAQPILELTDRVKARELLHRVQARWDEVGRVPRDRFREVEDQLRRIEAHVRKLDDEHWSNTNPEKQARQSGMSSQLHEAIARLEQDVAAAEAAGDPKRLREAQEALAARQSWLRAIGG